MIFQSVGPDACGLALFAVLNHIEWWSMLPSRGRLLLFVVLLPAIVAGSNQALLKLAQQGHLQPWLYPWLA